MDSSLQINSKLNSRFLLQNFLFLLSLFWPMTSWPNHLSKLEIGEFSTFLPFSHLLLILNSYYYYFRLVVASFLTWTVFSLTIVFPSCLVNLHILAGGITRECESELVIFFSQPPSLLLKHFPDSQYLF